MTQLLRVSHSPIQASSGAEQRAMSYFLRVVVPVLAGPLDGYFWTNIVAQVCHQERAAKHVVLAISSLYEALPSGPKWLPEGDGQKNPFAVWHYNEAIKQLRTTMDHGTILFVCILFVCVDFLRGDPESAINHCRHGINILNEIGASTTFMRDYVIPAFYRLSVFPYFFGVSPDTFPCLQSPLMVLDGPFTSVVDAHAALNPLVVRAIRFVRSADGYRLGAPPFTEPGLSTMQERQAVECALDGWFSAFHPFKVGQSQSQRSDDSRGGNVMELLEIRWLVCKTWIATCLSRNEGIYDAYMDGFRQIVALGMQAASMAELSPSSSPSSSLSPSPSSSEEESQAQGKFAFEMGFGPLLAFVMIKCRHLGLRIAAMGLMKKLSRQRENVWDSDIMVAAGRRMIEIEHDLELDADDEDLDGMIDDESPPPPPPPPEEKRIRDSVMLPDVEMRPCKKGGGNVAWRKICFLMKDPDGEGIVTTDEWFQLR